MSTVLRRMLSNVQDVFSPRSRSRKTASRRRSRFFAPLAVEGLEARCLLATFYVDDGDNFTVTNDTAPPGLSPGDTVTFNPGPNSGHPGTVAGLTFGTNAFQTIQAAVNAAAAGDTIRVGPGTYVEGVNVNKQLFVLGNQVGIDPQNPAGNRTGAPESIVTGVGNNGVSPFQITASDVELNGFTVEGATNANVFGFGILIGAGTSGTEIRNNIIQNNIAGISLANASTTNATIIERNLFQNNNAPGPVSGTGIYTDQFNAGGALNSVIIDFNTFNNNSNVAVNISPTVATSPASNITISRNVMTNNGNGLVLTDVLNSTITQNEIFSSTGSQVFLGGGNNNLLFTQNCIELGAARGMRLATDFSGTPNQNITLTGNFIEGNALAGLEINTGAYLGGTDSLNAENNWWGSATGPTNTRNPGGTGEEIVDPLNQVDFVPFLTSGADAQPDVRGCQLIGVASADLSVVKTDTPDPVTAGQTITYTIAVTNNGPDAAQNVLLSDRIPDNTTFVSFTAPVGWTAPTGSEIGTITTSTGTLASGATATFTMVVMVNAGTPTGTVISNAARVSAGTSDVNAGNNTSVQTTTVGPVEVTTDISVTKSDSPDPVTAGANLTYTIVVLNNGPGAATNAALTDVIPTGTTFVSLVAPAGWTNTTPAVGGTGTVTSTNPSLAAGSGPQTFTLVVHTNSSVVDGTILSNTATVATTTTDTNSANNTDTETTTVAAVADLSVTKTDSPDPVTAGQNITYTITLANAGASDAQAVNLRDVIPVNTTFVSAAQTSGPAFTLVSPAPGSTGTFTATAGTLAAGASATFTLVVNVNSTTPGGSNISNTATATSTTSDTNTANNSDTETTAVTPAPILTDLSVTKADSPDPVTAGANLTYTIVVTNNGPSAAANATLTDAIPANTTFVSLTAPAGWTTTTPTVGGTGTVTATNPSLAAGSGPQTFTLVVQANSSAAAGSTISNTATVATTTTDTNATNNSDTETTTVNTSADVSVTKTDSPDPVGAGSNLTYTIIVNNAGPSDAQTVTLTDAIPTGTTFVSLTAPAGWTNTTPPAGGTGAVTSTRTSLAAGSGPQTFTLIVNVPSSTAAGTTITNTANITSPTDTTEGNNSATTTTQVVISADLSITKSEDTTEVAPGDTLTYTIVVTNNGAGAAQNVTFTDAVPLNTTFVSATQTSGPAFTLTTPPAGGTGTVTGTIATLAAGASATFTMIVQVDSTAADGTTIDNTATVTSTTTDNVPGNNTATVSADVISPVAPLVCEVTTFNTEGAARTATLEDDADNPGAGALIVTGTSRNDVIIVEPKPGNSSRIRVLMNGRTIGTFNRSDVQHIVVFGEGGNDLIVVNATLSQQATLLGGSGNDQLFGGRGADGLDGGSGNDRLFGGSNNDTLCGGTGNDFVYGQNGNDIVGGDAGNDHLFGESGNDLVLGGDGNDFLYGGTGNDELFGQAGNDQIFGENGNDIAVGGDGNDLLIGGVGRDILIGGAGRDRLIGESGDDILVAGSTVHDEDQAALEAIMAEWASGRNYITRVNNIRFGGGANGAFTLDSGTVSDDFARDELIGNSGLDWFLFGSGDRLRDRSRNEQTN